MNEKDIEHCQKESIEFGYLALQVLYCYGAVLYPDQWGDYLPATEDLDDFARHFLMAADATSCPARTPDIISKGLLFAFFSVLRGDRNVIPRVTANTIRKNDIFSKMIDACSLMSLSYEYLAFAGEHYPNEDLAGGMTINSLWPDLSTFVMNRGRILRDQCFRVMGYWEGKLAEHRIREAERTGNSTTTKRRKRVMKENIIRGVVLRLVKDGSFNVDYLRATSITKIADRINSEAKQEFDKYDIKPPKIDTTKSILAGLEIDPKIKNAIKKM